MRALVLKNIVPLLVVALLLLSTTHLRPFDNDDVRSSSARDADVIPNTFGNMPKNIDGTFYDVGKHSSLDLQYGLIPHIAYYDLNNGDLKYTVYDGWDWNTTVVDSDDDVGAFSSLVLDSEGNPHIAYQNVSSLNLKYAHFNGSNWTNITLDETGEVGSYASIAISSNDNPHIAYRDETNENLKYAYYNGTDWTTMTLDGGAYNVGEYASIALDTANRPHITYYNQTAADLMYMFFDGSSWIKEIVYETNSVGKHTSIDLDGDGDPHIAFFNQTSNDLMYTHNSGGVWNTETVDSTGLVGEYTSISIGEDDEPHISYNDNTNSLVKYATKDNGTWIFKEIDEEGDYNSIVIDRYNRPHFSYYSTSDKNLRYLSGSGPAAVVVDSTMTQYRGGHSMQLDSNDVPHFAYENVNVPGSVNKGVSYSTLNVTATLETGVRVWDTQTVATIGGGDASNAFGEGISLTLDSNDLPHLSYRNNSKIQYSYFDGNNWSHEILSDSLGSSISSIKTDSTDNPHIIYRKNNFLKYVFWNGTGWTTMSVGPQGNTWHALDMDLALSDSDTPHICYWKSASSNMGKIAYAYYSGTDWVINNNVISDGLPSLSAVSGRYCDIEVDHLGKPHIAHDYHNGKLAFSKMNSTGDWNGWVITENQDVKHISLALDSLELPHISAYSGMQNDMIYSWYDGEEWKLRESGLHHTDHTYSSNDWGPYGEIDVDSNDSAHIAFIDWGPDNLIYYTDNFDIGLRDSDGDGTPDADDIFPTNPFEDGDSDGDGVGDNTDSCPGTEALAAVDANGCSLSQLDTDLDGVADDVDSCLSVSGTSTLGGTLGCPDSDSDGWADDIDDCPGIIGNSTIDRSGCPDADGDGVSDDNDTFPNDANESEDADGDSVGDNYDICPGTNISLFVDASGCAPDQRDTDSDGINDLNDGCLAIQGNSTMDKEGCPDADGDGMSDDNDAFMENPGEWNDTDDDGVGDNGDDFPIVDSQWQDSDGDGYGDNWGNGSWNESRSSGLPGEFLLGAIQSDYCPDLFGNSSTDGILGCPDADGDGVADLLETTGEQQVQDTTDNSSLTNDDTSTDSSGETDTDDGPEDTDETPGELKKLLIDNFDILNFALGIFVALFVVVVTALTFRTKSELDKLPEDIYKESVLEINGKKYVPLDSMTEDNDDWE